MEEKGIRTQWDGIAGKFVDQGGFAGKEILRVDSLAGFV